MMQYKCNALVTQIKQISVILCGASGNGNSDVYATISGNNPVMAVVYGQPQSGGNNDNNIRRRQAYNNDDGNDIDIR